MPVSRSIRRMLCLALVVALGQAVGDPLLAGEVRLKDGTILTGTPTELQTLYRGPARPNPFPTTTYPIWMIENPLQRYFVPRRQVESVNRDIDLSKGEVFRLKQKPMQNASVPIGVVGDYLDKPTPFDRFGRRVVKLRLSKGKPEVFQGITEITPVYAKLEALNHDWKTAIATSSIPTEVLDPILREANGSNDADHRMKIAVFYMQAQRYGAAEKELESIATDFPDRADRVRQGMVLLSQAKAQDLLNELKLLQRSGQHRFVYETSLRFPTENVDATVLREVREITEQYNATRERAAHAQMLLAELQAQLGSDERTAEVAPRRAEIVDSLNYTNLDRLDAFLKLADDQKLTPAEKMAIALSGWVVGSANAVTELEQALRFWQARMLLLEYLRTGIDDQRGRDSVRERLRALEGISVARIAQMLPLLPPVLDPAGAEPSKPIRIEAGDGKGEPAAYWILLPPEYHPDHQYPLLVALHSEKRPPEKELTFWGGTGERNAPAQRHGYIVIVPEYSAKAGQTHYDYSSVSHQIVLDSIRDARRRFNIDSDRIFLAGHDMGGDAAFDIGLSHPDLFAGAIPIAGMSDRYCEYYWENAKNLPLYVINGQLDGNTVVKNTKELMRMMPQGFNVIYVEYVGSGPDSFYAEIHKLFDWMSRLRRNPLSKEIDVKTLRETDNHFAWYEFEGLPKSVTDIDWNAAKRGPIRPMAVEGKVNEANTIVISKSGAAKHRIWLTPQNGLIDFNKRVGVRINGSQKFNDLIKPDLEAMLEYFRFHGDRQQLFWAKLDFSSGR